ncbi:MAG: HAD family hydrolase [Candidatus Thorarchaeota archaeon]
MSHPPIILFDFDGVIITQKSLEYTASKLIKKELFRWKNIEKMRLIDFARLFEESDSKNKLAALKQINQVYKPFIPSIWRRNLFFIKFRRSYPKLEKYETLKLHLKSVLKKLQKSGFILGIVSNTSKERLERFRKRLNLDQYFSVFISRNDSPFRKPHSYPIIIALNHIKKLIKTSINRDNVYYIGDLPADIECAKNAGIHSIALLSGHGTKIDLEKANPTFLLPDIKDMLQIDQFKKFLLD